ncbi:Fe(3+)-citrate import system permease protein yfmE [Streptomyces leeuwenhoekii]|uniref:Fe(3+)-citrate import system permease protein yfmE n=1 Tax=Streptomyces leeuwenhoekii TaxID=1437453 RepID=A0A0F7VTJ2_STRLW|nr:Fe(3+)-citrate import system permease protein yfmE [Streptomyces leeuwenhoekii]
MRRPAGRAPGWQPLLVVALLAVASVCALSLGTPHVPPHRLAGALLDGDTTLTGIVVTELRVPRLVLALVAGACLGAAGLVLQEALRNPLAVPEMLGVSSGAALGVAAPLVLTLSLPAAVQPLLAIGGAALGGGLTLLAAGLGRSPSAVLLTGAAVAAALQAALLVLMVMADQLDLQLIYRYLLGSLSARTWDDVAGLWPWLVVAAPALVLCAPVLSVMRLGDEDAEALGVRARRAQLAALAIAVVLIAPVTAVCGPVAWVGFLAPHLARWFNPGAGAVRWLSWSVVWGAVVVTAADVPARLALAPVETPVGAWTALLGVPAGVALMRSGGRGRGRARRATVAGAAVRTAPQDVPSGSVSGVPRPEVPGHTRGIREAGGGAAPVPGGPTGTEEAR